MGTRQFPVKINPQTLTITLTPLPWGWKEVVDKMGLRGHEWKVPDTQAWPQSAKKKVELLVFIQLVSKSGCHVLHSVS